jgi:Domain of Unknown Function (DUF748)
MGSVMSTLLRQRPPRWLMVIASVAALYTVFGFLILPRIIRSEMESRLPALLHRPVTVRQVLFNPYAMSITIRGFLVKEPDGSPLLAFEELYVDVAVWKHLRGGVHLQTIKLVQPVVGVAVEKGGKLNFADLLEQPAEKPAGKKPEGKPLLFEVARLELDRGALSFADNNRPHPFKARLEPLSFALDGFSTEPQKNGAYDFKARLEPSTEFAWTGSISTTPLKSEGIISISGIQLAQFGSYTDDSTQLRITSGALDLRAKYTFDASQTPTVIKLDDGSAKLSKLRIDPPGHDEALLSIDSLSLAGLSADVATQEAKLHSVSLEGGHLLARRLKDGRLELAELAKPANRAPAVTAAAKSAAEPAKPWTTRLDELRVSRVGVVWQDEVPAQPARLTVDDLALKLGPLQFPGDVASKFESSMRLNGDGRFEAQGTAHAGAGSVETQFALTNLAFAPFQPYASQTITATIPRGTLEVKGRASFTPAKDGAAAKTKFNGDVAIDRFSLVDTEGKELAGFDRFALGKLDTDTVNTTLDLVSLKGARVHYRINPDKQDNWSTLMRSAKPAAAPSPEAIPVAVSTPVGAPAAAPEPPAAAAPKPATVAATPAAKRGPEAKTSIKAIAIENLSFDFTDKSLSPAYLTRLTQFGGKISPFTQPGLAKSRIDLTGKLDGARLLVAGTLRPAGKDSDADLVVSLASWNLPPATPYGIKFAGYPVEKGKLSLDLKYKVAGRKLNASNLLTINQLTLGSAVESPTATKLPVKLALAILTDRSGKLAIDLPIEGSLDDPDFRIGKVVVHTLLNVLEKAATAPFALLGSLLGSSEDLSALEFESGSDDLAQAEQEKLARLVKALIDRPALQLSITGLSDPESDKKGLLQSALDDALVGKRRSLTAQGKQPPPDEQALTEQERTAALHALFVERVVMPREQQAAALKAAGKLVPADLVARRDLPQPEAEALLRDTFALSPDDYAGLARARAEAVQEALAEVKGLDPSRVFISTAKADADKQRKALLQLE